MSPTVDLDDWFVALGGVGGPIIHEGAIIKPQTGAIVAGQPESIPPRRQIDCRGCDQGKKIVAARGASVKNRAERQSTHVSALRSLFGDWRSNPGACRGCSGHQIEVYVPRGREDPTLISSRCRFSFVPNLQNQAKNARW